MPRIPNRWGFIMHTVAISRSQFVTRGSLEDLVDLRLESWPHAKECMQLTIERRKNNALMFRLAQKTQHQKYVEVYYAVGKIRSCNELHEFEFQQIDGHEAGCEILWVDDSSYSDDFASWVSGSVYHGAAEVLYEADKNSPTATALRAKLVVCLCLPLALVTIAEEFLGFGTGTWTLSLRQTFSSLGQKKSSFHHVFRGDVSEP